MPHDSLFHLHAPEPSPCRPRQPWPLCHISTHATIRSHNVPRAKLNATLQHKHHIPKPRLSLAITHLQQASDAAVLTTPTPPTTYTRASCIYRPPPSLHDSNLQRAGLSFAAAVTPYGSHSASARSLLPPRSRRHSPLLRSQASHRETEDGCPNEPHDQHS